MKYTIKKYPELKKKVEQMSIEELLRAVICPAVSSDNEISRGTAAERCAREIARQAVKVTRERIGVLPLQINANSKIAHVVLHSSWVTELACAEEVGQKLSTHVQVDIFVDPGGDKLSEIAKSGEYDYIVCSVLEQGAYGLNTAKLVGPAARNMMCGWMRYKTPVVFVGYYNPYFGKTFEASVDTFINSHGFTEYTADAIVETLLGE